MAVPSPGSQGGSWGRPVSFPCNSPGRSCGPGDNAHGLCFLRGGRRIERRSAWGGHTSRTPCPVQHGTSLLDRHRPLSAHTNGAIHDRSAVGPHPGGARPALVCATSPSPRWVLDAFGARASEGGGGARTALHGRPRFADGRVGADSPGGRLGPRRTADELRRASVARGHDGSGLAGALAGPGEDAGARPQTSTPGGSPWCGGAAASRRRL